MKITYRPLEKKDLILRHRWLNHPEVRKYLGPEVRDGSDLGYHKEWFENYFQNEKSRIFIILVDGEPVGNVGLNDIDDKVDRNGGVHLVIGEPEFWHRGIGKEAMKFLIDYAFNKLRLHKIFLVVAEHNLAAIKLYEKLGFEQEGTFKDQTFINGRFQNEVWMGLINPEF